MCSYAKCNCAVFQYAASHYVKCHCADQSVIILSFIMLSDIMLSAFMPSDSILGGIVLSVIVGVPVMCGIALSVIGYAQCHFTKCPFILNAIAQIAVMLSAIISKVITPLQLIIGI
jgi:hypothetical protein